MKTALKSWIRWLFGRKPYNGMERASLHDASDAQLASNDTSLAVRFRESVWRDYETAMGMGPLRPTVDGNRVIGRIAIGRIAAHCDPLIVHAPGDCVYCDKVAADLQKRRIQIGMNFTGESDPNKLTDPATRLRSPDQAQAWHGNAPTVEIIVNGKRHIARRGGLITYGDVVELAYGFGERRRDFTMTVRGRTESKSMLPGDSVKVQSGMVFNVVRTNHA